MPKKEKTIEVEFRCTVCDRLVFEEIPESEYHDNMETTFEHDFDCLDPDNWSHLDDETE